MDSLQREIERLYTHQGPLPDKAAAHRVFAELRALLSEGKVRSAEPDAASPTGWKVNAWVKQGILLGFRLGELAEMGDPKTLSFVDKDTFPARRLRVSDRVRVVPGGSAIRSGSHVAAGVICMPPMYINVGAFVDEGSMVDSHVLVGSCAQIGKRVHLSAGSQIGGVLEPVNASPVIIEDDAMVGGNCGIYEGTLVRKRAVIGAGVVMTRSTPIYDVVRGEVHRSTPELPLIVPENAVVVPGARHIEKGKAAEWGLSLYTPVIVKYRDEKTGHSIELEDLLR
jgi:2,3,4,5-tetrahydropyridine-2-carboxylate N-succinyltransferase